MLLTGTISILQMILLPGLVLCNILKLRPAGSIQKWLYIFSFSLYSNYVIVTLLVLLSIYYSLTVWLIVLAELVYLAIIYRKQILSLKNGTEVKSYFLFLFNIYRHNTGSAKVLAAAAVFILLFYAAVLTGNAGTVFYFTDTVNNYEWNKWAIDFSNNILPKFSSHFPQLLPANWSLCYVLTGCPDIHFFPKAVMPLFILGILLMFADLALNRNNSQYLAALIIYGLFAPIVFSLVFIADGNADLPVAFFSFLAFYSFVLSPAQRTDIMEDKKIHIRGFVYPLAGRRGTGYIITFLFATMAAATKLAGFYTFTVSCVLLPISYIYSRNQIRRGLTFKTGIILLFACGISLFWYIKAPDVMYSGLHQPEYVADNYTDSAMNALSLMYYHWGAPVLAFMMITVIASLFHKRIIYVSVVMVMIPLLLWMFKYSPDFRNLSFVIPYMCLCSAAGLYKVAEFIVPRGRPVNSIFINTGETSFRSEIKMPVKILNLFLISVSAAGTGLFIFSLSDSFYYIVLSVYEFIHKYYFRSNRILYFVDFTLILHAEFYQRVFTALSVIITVIPLMILFKIKIKHIMFFAAVSVISASFFITRADIIKHQQNSYNKVDAHNYYSLISTILREKDTSRIVLTNFREITDYKFPGRILFIYSDDTGKLLAAGVKNKIVFLKLETGRKNLSSEVQQAINNNKFNVLLKDDRYILFSTE
jgi:hypothetical protein